MSLLTKDKVILSIPSIMACVECRRAKARTKTDLIKHESLPPQRIQRSSPLGHIESPGDTSDVDVQQGFGILSGKKRALVNQK